MLETALALAFGFCAALFLVLLFAPAVARRVSELTWRQATRVLPQSSEEIAAARDHLRGQNAIEIRKLEMKMEVLADKERQLRIGRQSHEDQISILKSQTEELGFALEKLETEGSRLAGALENELERNAILATDHANGEIKAAAISAELSQLHSDHARQATALHAKDEAYKLAMQGLETGRTEASGLRSRLSGVESEMRIARSDARRSDSDVKIATRKIAALETKLERSIRFMAEAEEKLERREVELKRYKDQAKTALSVAISQPPRIKPMQQRPQPAPETSEGNGSQSALIVTKINTLLPALRLAAHASPDEQRRLKVEMMDLAGRVTAEAAAENASLKTKIAQLQPKGSVLSEAILKYHKTAAE